VSAFASIPDAELVTVAGAQRAPSLSGPNFVMSALDKPEKSLGVVRDALGIARSSDPGSTYVPAALNSDGSINPGRLDVPMRYDSQVPRTQ
jgi:hypothetical protein